MKRESVNYIRYFLEEWIPPALRELKRMHYLLHAALGHKDEPT